MNGEATGIHESTSLLSKGASLKLLADMLKQAEAENAELLEALKDIAGHGGKLYSNPHDGWSEIAMHLKHRAQAAIRKAEGSAGEGYTAHQRTIPRTWRGRGA